MSATENAFQDQEQVYEGDTILVLNDKSKIQAVKSVKDGEVETVNPTHQNSGQFIRVDRTGDIVTNFFSNFFRQLKDPFKFIYLKVPHDEAVEKAGKIQKHLKNSSVEGDELIKKFEISKKFISQLLEMQETNTRLLEGAIKNQQQINNHIMDTQQNNSFRFSPEEIDWQRLASWGVTKDQLEKKNQLEILLKGFRTSELIPINLKVGSDTLRCDARLSLQRDENGNVNMSYHGIRKERNLDFPYLGHQFTEEDKKNLKLTGNMGRTVNLQYLNGDIEPSVISIDRMTNELVAYKTKYIKIPDEIKQVKLTDEQKQILAEGKPLRLEGMTSLKGEKFDGNIQFNADKRFVELLFDNKYVSQQIKGSRDEMSQSNPGEVPRIFRQKELSEEQYANLKAGETVYIDGLIDKRGNQYQGYITYNAESGKINFQFPNQVKEQAKPIERDATQIAVNSEGKTSEATKNLNEPLKTGQQNPDSKQQKDLQEDSLRQSQSKGRKMR
ncbi:DUF3945 domain-containing protein [Pedobacter sp. KLB.chiD]|uniref:DUF3945 domain-containing protein n=1 Tax=Pedobacter sp. KLB.chiD TaxID=3387402 RepID=UPI00399AB307